jgi:NAD(P)-dependent dehydrogenase (short-subunit alcohol dehydrogenase family)
MVEGNCWVVVTGGTSGIGLATIRQLAERGVAVIGIGRSEERCAEAMEMVGESVPHVRVEWLAADLSSLRSVGALAEKVCRTVKGEEDGHLVALINNAATVSSRHVTTRDGLELQFAVNHAAAFVLEIRLLPLLAASRRGRIINVTTGSHRSARIRFDDLQLRRRYGPLRAYGQSKLAQLLVAYELDRRLARGCGVRSLAFDPGLVNTGIGEKATGGAARLFWKLRRRAGMDPSVPAATLSRLVTGEVPPGVYHGVDPSSRPSRTAQDPELGRRVWETTEQITGVLLADNLPLVEDARSEQSLETRA